MTLVSVTENHVLESALYKAMILHFAKNYKIGNFWGSSIWLKQATERENHLQKYLLLSCLLPK